MNALNRSPRQIVDALRPVISDSQDSRKLEPALQSVIDAFNTLGVSPTDAAGLFDEQLRKQVADIASAKTPSRIPATAIALWWNDPKATEAARAIIADPKASAAVRGEFVKASAPEEFRRHQRLCRTGCGQLGSDSRSADGRHGSWGQ